METIQITLPDGVTREVPRGTTAAEIANQISPRLAKEALVARTNGELIDLSRPLDHDTKLLILTARIRRVQVFPSLGRTSACSAVLELYPNVNFASAPIDNGFFYEFVRDEPLHPTPREDRSQDARTREKNIPNERKFIPSPKRFELYRSTNQEFKCELVEEKAVEPMVSFYTTGKFIDFCRGPTSLDRPHQRRSSCERRRRLLEGTRRQSADAAHLRRLLRRSEGARRISPQTSKNPSAAIIANSARNSISSAFRRSRPRLIFWQPQGRPHPK